MKRKGHLFERLISDENLGKAIEEVNATHHWRGGHRPNACTAWVEETKPDRIRDLRRFIVQGFEPKAPRIIERYDASARKNRTISEPAQWPDQYVHHALVQVIQPVMMRGMDRFACGSIRKRGPHYAKRYIEKWLSGDLKGTRYELCGDIRHFYDSLKPEVVMARMRELIKDHGILDLIERVTRNGILIGAYPSQWFANTTLQPLDQMIRQSGLCTHYVRYMDNLTIFGPNKRKLRKLKDMIVKWLGDHGLTLKGDWQIFPVPRDTEKKELPHPRKGVTRPGRVPDAVGYRFGRDFVLPRKHNLIRVKRALARYRKHQTRRLAESLLSRIGQLKHCNNFRLYKRLYKGERIVRRLKQTVRENRRKEDFLWSMYLAQRETERSSRLRAACTPT